MSYESTRMVAAVRDVKAGIRRLPPEALGMTTHDEDTHDEESNTLGGRLSRSSIVMGPHGLRAGWGCLLFLLLTFAISFFVHLVVALVLHGSRPLRGAAIAPGFLLTSEGSSALIILLATLGMARFEGRPLRDYGFAPRAALARGAGGLVAGFTAISALVGLLWSAHLLTLHGPVLSSGRGLAYGCLWALGFLFVGIFEELLLRGYLLFTLARGIGFLPAALLLSALFGFIHRANAGETPVGLFSAAAVGLLFCLSIWYTGSLWWAIGFHVTWDWGESFFWGTSDSGMLAQGRLFQEHPLGNLLMSGGLTGPEGSVLIFPLLLVVALLMFLWWRRKSRAQLPAFS